MKYNTEGKRIDFARIRTQYPKYGGLLRDYQDREERKRCANTIINISGETCSRICVSVNDFESISSGIIWRSWPILSSI